MLSVFVFFGAQFLVKAHGGDTSLIHACVRTNNGTIRIVGANEACQNNESPLDWSQSVSQQSSKSGFLTFTGSANINQQCAGTSGNFGSCSDTERQILFPSSGNLKKLIVWPYRNTNTNGGPANITVLLNNVPTTLQVQIPAGSTSTVLDTEDLSVEEGDLVTIQSYDPTGQPGDTSFNVSLEYVLN